MNHSELPSIFEEIRQQFQDLFTGTLGVAEFNPTTFSGLPIIPDGGMMKTVYIASPYTVGDVAVNVRTQMTVADQLITLGFAPHVPLYSHFQHMFIPREYEDRLMLDLIWVLKCDYLLRLPGESLGADGEVDYARSNGIPVFYSILDLPKQALGRLPHIR